MPKTHSIRILPSQDYLRECFDYDSETGGLTWGNRPRRHFPTDKSWKAWNTRFAGKPAGGLTRSKEGYININLQHVVYRAHRLIWKWMTAEEPPQSLDHRDRTPSNNRWLNLRPATHAQQLWNTRARKDSVTGFKGVRQLPSGRYQAFIEHRSLGVFSTPEEASAAYMAATRKHRGDFHHG